MENVFLAESGSASIIDAKKTAKKKYKCPYCEARIEEAGEILSLWPYRPMMKGNGAVKSGTDRE